MTLFEMGWNDLIWGLVVTGLGTGVAVALAIASIRFLKRLGEGPTPNRSVSILAERYARGEIDRNEFLERRMVLLNEREGRPVHDL